MLMICCFLLSPVFRCSHDDEQNTQVEKNIKFDLSTDNVNRVICSVSTLKKQNKKTVYALIFR